MENLTVLLDDNGTFSDISIDVENYTRDETSLNLIAAEDSIYIGYKKRFSDIFICLSSFMVGNTLSFEFWNGVAWVNLEVKDLTKSFSRIGFLDWDSQVDGWVANEVNSVSKFWIRIKLTNDGAFDIKGIHTIFCDDNDLKDLYRKVDDFREPSDISFIATHQAARKLLMQDLRNEGRTKKKLGDLILKDIFVWDLLDRSQLREAACNLALALIFFNVSDNTDGKFIQLANSFKKKYQSALAVYLLNIDTNDDGTFEGDHTAVRHCEIKMM